MDLLVLFPLEFLANLPMVDVDRTNSRGTKALRPKKTRSVEEEDDDSQGNEELEGKTKLRFEFTKIPALFSLKPN